MQWYTIGTLIAYRIEGVFHPNPKGNTRGYPMSAFMCDSL